MAGRPKDPTINKKIYEEINRLLETIHFRDITIDQISENTGILKRRFIADGKINRQLLWICLLNNHKRYLSMRATIYMKICIIFSENQRYL